MANRYTYTKILTETDTNKKYMESTIYPKVKPSNNDFFVITEASDRLDLLAKKYYGDSNMWWVIAVANNLNEGSFFAPEGIQLRIPANIQNILSDFQKINR